MHVCVCVCVCVCVIACIFFLWLHRVHSSTQLADVLQCRVQTRVEAKVCTCVCVCACVNYMWSAMCVLKRSIGRCHTAAHLRIAASRLILRVGGTRGKGTFTSAHTHTHTHTQTHTHTRMHTPTHTHTQIHTCMHACTHTRTQTHTHMHAITHANTHRPTCCSTWLKAGTRSCSKVSIIAGLEPPTCWIKAATDSNR